MRPPPRDTMNALLEPSPYENDQGGLIGRDPRELTPSDFAAAGVALMPVMKAIRAYCIDCCGGQIAEVRKCVSMACPLWPMRMGNYPVRLRSAANGAGAGRCDVPLPRNSPPDENGGLALNISGGEP